MYLISGADRDFLEDKERLSWRLKASFEARRIRIRGGG
jgi:hypothetical protein